VCRQDFTVALSQNLSPPVKVPELEAFPLTVIFDDSPQRAWSAIVRRQYYFLTGSSGLPIRVVMGISRIKGVASGKCYQSPQDGVRYTVTYTPAASAAAMAEASAHDAFSHGISMGFLSTSAWICSHCGDLVPPAPMIDFRLTLG
jgi:hypothetical protein